MKKNLASSLLLVLVLGVFGLAISFTPPGGVRWGVFLEDPASGFKKVVFLLDMLLRPAVLSFTAITLLQLQFRLASSGANKRTVFSVCAIASATMMLGLRSLSLSSSGGPSYVAGMALGYTVMSRLYAIRVRTFYHRVRVPWPVWRGNKRAVQEMDEMVRAARNAQAAC